MRDLEGRTIGVAISIPEPHGTELSGWQRSFGDPKADAVPPHITLVPPTEIDPVNVDSLEEHLSEVASSSEPFVVQLRGTATFRPVSPVVFVALARGISECEMLSKAVRNGPLLAPLRFPYHPHVTVAHDLPESAMNHAFDALADYAVEFVVDTFGLYTHGRDGGWRQERGFALGDSQASL